MKKGDPMKYTLILMMLLSFTAVSAQSVALNVRSFSYVSEKGDYSVGFFGESVELKTPGKSVLLHSIHADDSRAVDGCLDITLDKDVVLSECSSFGGPSPRWFLKIDGLHLKMNLVVDGRMFIEEKFKDRRD
jgi:hypothetical protein